jgi:import inner membrane translocase subunit TIM50
VRPNSDAGKREPATEEASPETTDPVYDGRPLPDLTQGIPSTLEYETTGSSRASPLNLTEAGEPGQVPGGGRGKGELPASAYVSSSEKKRAKFANIMYAMFALLCATGTVYLGRNWETAEEELEHEDAPSGWGFGLMWNRAKARLRDQLNYYNEPAFRKLLPDVDPLFERPYTLVLSMEDLLIHSEWTREHGWRMAKRPGVDYFLRYLSQYYELVIFTSQPSALADPVIRKLDPYHIVTWPLFREATLYEKGEYIKVCISNFCPFISN